MNQEKNRLSLHIDAKPGEIAETVLLPGDPLRAKHIADTMLEQTTCYNQVRNMYGFTGLYMSSDNFYNADPELWKLWAAYGVLAIEMESAAFYTLAAQHQVEALTILTVSDSLVTGEEEPAAAREKAFTQMFEIALEIAE
jgi:purine-nucleoside phosphorylase